MSNIIIAGNKFENVNKVTFNTPDGSLATFWLEGLSPQPPTPEFDPIFANNTPEQISAVSAYISENNYNSTQVKQTFGWDLQTDTKPITLTNGEVIEVGFLGFNHDDKSDGTGKAGITLGMKNCLNTDYGMSVGGHTNAGGYFNSNFATQDLPTIYNLLPDEWKSIIKPVYKKAANGGGANYSAVITQSCNIFLLSAIELYGENANIGNNLTVSEGVEGGINEGHIYEYWVDKINSDRVKTHVNGTTLTRGWWLRSIPSIAFLTPSGSEGGATMYFFRCSGAPQMLGARNAAGISFAFCV